MTQQEKEKSLNVTRFRQLNDSEPSMTNLITWCIWFRDERHFKTLDGAMEYLLACYRSYEDEFEIVAAFRHPQAEEEEDDDDDADSH